MFYVYISILRTLIEILWIDLTDDTHICVIVINSYV